MSKVEALRAMREARYAARRSAAGVAPAPAAAAVPPAPGPVAAAKKSSPSRSRLRAADPAEVVQAGPEAAEAAESLCGHRNMSGKTCRRPSGHSEKNHRYS